MKYFKILFIILLTAPFTGCKPSLTEPEAGKKLCHFPNRVGFVNDYCAFLTVDERVKLERSIAGFHTQTGTEIIIVIEDSKKPHSRKFHCPQGIAQQWKLGPPEKFNDFLIVVSRKRKYVDFSYGLKFNRLLTPEQHNHLLYKIILPAFRRKAYCDGLHQAVEYFAACRNGSPVTPKP